jgi:NAD(P)-dependent dehydrogenase (short-subunit alcohol dehydrogenase family)
VLVPGPGSGIGRAAARAFTASGARVVVVGRRLAPLVETGAGEPLVADVGGHARGPVIARAVP